MKTDLRSRILAWITGPVPTSVILAFVIGAGFIMFAGADPITGYQSLFQGSFGSAVGIAETLKRAIPLVGMALAIAVAFRAGVINLGAEGQMILGGLAGMAIALNLPGPPLVVMLAACITGAVVGAIWSMLSALLQLWPGVPILITSLLLNYPARSLSAWMIRFPMRDPDAQKESTLALATEKQIPLIASPASDTGGFLVDSFGKDNVVTVVGRTLNWSLLVVIILVAAVMFMNARTKFGFESGINGLNPHFTRFSGTPAGKLTVQTMLISGSIAGLMGVMFIIGAPNVRLADGQLLGTNYAWTGLLVALLARYRPGGVVIAGVFFAGIVAGSGSMGRELSMSPQIAAVIQGIVIILIAFRVQIPRRTRRRHDETAVVAEQEMVEEETGRV